MNDGYVVRDGNGGSVVLKEKHFHQEQVEPQKRIIELILPRAGMALKLDHDNFETSRKRSKPPLFHFLDDTAKLWSNRCDFVIFYVNRLAFHADCVEFKSKKLSADKIVPQLNAGMNWLNTLKRTIEHYTGDKRRIRARKFVFADNKNLNSNIDSNRQLIADPSIRYYHFERSSRTARVRASEHLNAGNLNYVRPY